MLELRPYQQEAHDLTWAALEDGKSALCVLGTGAGKTEIGLSIANRFLNDERFNHLTALWLGHRTELVTDPLHRIDANWETIAQHGTGMEMANSFANGSRFNTASVQTLYNKNRRQQFLSTHPIGLVIYDEAHHSVSESNLRLVEALKEHNPDVMLMGITATPKRENKGEGLVRLFDEVTYKMSFPDLIEKGFLVPPKGRMVKIQKYLMEQLQRSSTGEFTAGSVRDALKAVNADELVVNTWKDQAVYPNGEIRPTMVVTGTVEEAYWIADAFKQAGIEAVGVDGTTPKAERREILERMRNEQLTVVTNCGVFTEGTDIKSIGCILNMRPIRSKTLYTQIIGRGLRPYTTQSGFEKTDCLIIDFVPDDQRNLQLGKNLLGDWFPTDGKWYTVEGWTHATNDSAMIIQAKGLDAITVQSDDDIFSWIQSLIETGMPWQIQIDAREMVVDAREKPKPQEKGAAILNWLMGASEHIDFEELVIEEQDLIATHASAFSTTAQGIVITPLNDKENVAVVPPNHDTTNTWSVYKVNTDWKSGYVKQLAMRSGSTQFSTMEEAIRYADAYVDLNGDSMLAAKNKKWRNGKASDGQKNFADKLKIEYPDDISKGDLATLITQALTIKKLNRHPDFKVRGK